MHSSSWENWKAIVIGRAIGQNCTERVKDCFDRIPTSKNKVLVKINFLSPAPCSCGKSTESHDQGVAHPPLLDAVQTFENRPEPFQKDQGSQGASYSPHKIHIKATLNTCKCTAYIHNWYLAIKVKQWHLQYWGADTTTTPFSSCPCRSPSSARTLSTLIQH